MKQVFTDVIQFRGNHYDFGYKQGELLRNSPILANRRKQWATKRKRHFTIDEKESVHLLETFIPGMMDELQGLADALKMNREDALREFGGHYVDYGRSGCSILTGSEYLIRNYDSHPGTYEGRYLIFQPLDTGYATIGPTMQITGRIDGLNEKGLTMGYNFVNRVGSGDGFICNMIGRIILETCSNVEEAIGLLKEIPHRTSFNYALLDSSGESFVVEASPRSVVERKANISTNHFEMLTDENRFRTDESVSRQQMMGEQQKEGTDVYHGFRLLNDSDKNVFSSKYGAWSGTLHTSAYLPHDRKAWFATGADRMPVIFDFKHFLQGEKINIKQIKGKLDYHTAFMNRDMGTGPVSH